MTKKPKIESSADLYALAKQYHIENNALFLTAIEQYEIQQRVIRQIKAAIEETELTVAKSYVKGETNIYINPLAKELPQHANAANKTAGIILEIIVKLGHKDPLETPAVLDFIK